jgi:hypothetical protein
LALQLLYPGLQAQFKEPEYEHPISGHDAEHVSLKKALLLGQL